MQAPLALGKLDGHELLDGRGLLPPTWCVVLAFLGQCVGCVVLALPLALNIEDRVNHFLLGELSESLDALRHWMFLVSVVCFGTGVQLVAVAHVAMGQDLKWMLEDISSNSAISEELRSSVAARKQALPYTWLLVLVFFEACCFTVQPLPQNYRCGLTAAALALLTLFVQYSIVNRFLAHLVDICRAGVRVVIDEMSPPDGASAIEWADVFNAHKRLDARMDALWELKNASLIVGPGVFGRLLVAVVILAEAFEPNSPEMKVVLCLGALLMAFVCLLYLWPLAEITDLCTNTSGQCMEAGASIHACALNVIGATGFGSQQRTDHLRYMQFLSAHTTGVELGSILITKSLIIKTSYQLLTSVPIALAILRKLLSFDHRHEA